MPLLAIFTGNINQSQYEALRNEVNWESQQPNGGIFHCVGFDDAGRIHVADVWESAETMNTFVEQRLVPAFKKLEIQPPEVSVYPTYNINAYASMDQYKI